MFVILLQRLCFVICTDMNSKVVHILQSFLMSGVGLIYEHELRITREIEEHNW